MCKSMFTIKDGKETCNASPIHTKDFGNTMSYAGNGRKYIFSYIRCFVSVILSLSIFSYAHTV